MTQAPNEISDKASQTPVPGYLMTPFGWAAKPLAIMLETDPSLYTALFTLNRQRMHLVALALAHWHGEIDAAFSRLLIRGAPQAILDAVLDHRPPGLRRALGHLPVGVVPRATYRQLVELLEEPTIAKLIFHRDVLKEKYLGLLHSIPAPLRRIAAGAIDDLGPEPEGLTDGLRILVARGVAPSFDALVGDLAAMRQPAQFIARIGTLVQQLQLPEAAPPAVVGAARRLDDIAEIRRLAKRWKNCLIYRYLDAVIGGRSAVYFWPHEQAPAVCVVNDHGRLSWALEAPKGPQNTDLLPARLEEICGAFAALGIPKESAIGALEHTAQALSPSWRGIRHRRRRQDADFEEMLEREFRGWAG